MQSKGGWNHGLGDEGSSERDKMQRGFAMGKCQGEQSTTCRFGGEERILREDGLVENHQELAVKCVI